MCMRELEKHRCLTVHPCGCWLDGLCKAVSSMSGAELEVCGAGITRKHGNEVEKGKDALESVSCRL